MYKTENNVETTLQPLLKQLILNPVQQKCGEILYKTTRHGCAAVWDREVQKTEYDTHSLFVVKWENEEVGNGVNKYLSG